MVTIRTQSLFGKRSGRDEDFLSHKVHTIYMGKILKELRNYKMNAITSRKSMNRQWSKAE
jgi:hypothetical protein